jgi:hypothetical protein
MAADRRLFLSMMAAIAGLHFAAIGRLDRTRENAQKAVRCSFDVRATIAGLGN